MIEIAGRSVGRGAPCLIVAELGTGHLGDPDRARRLVEAAAEAGADCVKLQLVRADEILHPRSGEVDLPTGRIELYRRFQELEQPLEFYARLKSEIEARGMLFLCSAFGLRSARELRSLGVPAIKIASPELNHLPLLEEVAGYGLPLVLSSGVSRLGDIERAVEIVGRERTVLLHCVTAYPAPEEEYNVRVLESLRRVFGVEVGLSDHSRDPVLVPALAVAHDASVVEKHFTLSQADSGLDDPIALEPAGFRRMTEAIRRMEANKDEALVLLEREYGSGRVERVTGSGVKVLAPSERQNYGRTNRSIHAVAAIPAGAMVGPADVAILRTEQRLRPGLPPEYLPLVIGRRARRAIEAGEGVAWDDIG